MDSTALKETAANLRELANALPDAGSITIASAAAAIARTAGVAAPDAAIVDAALRAALDRRVPSQMGFTGARMRAGIAQVDVLADVIEDIEEQARSPMAVADANLALRLRDARDRMEEDGFLQDRREFAAHPAPRERLALACLHKAGNRACALSLAGRCRNGIMRIEDVDRWPCIVGEIASLVGFAERLLSGDHPLAGEIRHYEAGLQLLVEHCRPNIAPPAEPVDLVDVAIEIHAWHRGGPGRRALREKPWRVAVRRSVGPEDEGLAVEIGHETVTGEGDAAPGTCVFAELAAPGHAGTFCIKVDDVEDAVDLIDLALKTRTTPRRFGRSTD